MENLNVYTLLILQLRQILGNTSNTVISDVLCYTAVNIMLPKPNVS